MCCNNRDTKIPDANSIGDLCISENGTCIPLLSERLLSFAEVPVHHWPEFIVALWKGACQDDKRRGRVHDIDFSAGRL
jgi:hypothetical protein